MLQKTIGKPIFIAIVGMMLLVTVGSGCTREPSWEHLDDKVGSLYRNGRYEQAAQAAEEALRKVRRVSAVNPVWDVVSF